MTLLSLLPLLDLRTALVVRRARFLDFFLIEVIELVREELDNRSVSTLQEESYTSSPSFSWLFEKPLRDDEDDDKYLDGRNLDGRYFDLSFASISLCRVYRGGLSLS